MRRVAVGGGVAVVAAFAVAFAGLASPMELGARVDAVAAERRSSRRGEGLTPVTELLMRLPPEPRPIVVLATARTTAPVWARAVVWSLGMLLVVGVLARLVLVGGLVVLGFSGMRDRTDAQRPGRRGATV